MYVSCARRKRKLYENYNCPDDYTDDTFLEELRKNVHVRKVTFSEAFYGTCLLSEQLSLIIIFISCFVYLHNGIVGTSSMITCTVIAVFLPYLILFRSSYNFIRIFRFLLIYTVTSYIYGPVFRTLMKTVSTDTIYILSAMLLFLHLLFYDYGVPCLVIPKKVPLFFAIFSAVCLVSRFTSYNNVFAFTHVTVFIFAICPVFLTKIGLSYKLVFVMVGTAATFLYAISGIYSLAFIALIIVVNVICPYYFVKWHSYKDNIYGPWDEATLNEKHKR